MTHEERAALVKLATDATKIGRASSGDEAHTNRNGKTESAASAVEPITVGLDTVTPENVEWIWQRWIPRGKLTLLAGHPGLGKSTVALDLAARVSIGEKMPDGTSGVEPSNVVLLSAEDGPADTIVPRLIRSGADLARIKLLTSYRIGTGSHDRDLDGIAGHSLQAIEAAIRLHSAALLIIDPLSAHMGSADSYKNSEVRALLRPLGDIAAKYGCAILLIEHLNKTQGQTVLHRVGGSVGLTAVARAVHMLVKHPVDASLRVLFCAKLNVAAQPDPIGVGFASDGAIEWTDAPTDFDPHAAVTELPPSRAREESRNPASCRPALVAAFEKLGSATKTEACKAAALASGRRKQRYFEELEKLVVEGVIVRDGSSGKYPTYRLSGCASTREPEPIGAPEMIDDSAVPVPVVRSGTDEEPPAPTDDDFIGEIDL